MNINLATKVGFLSGNETGIIMATKNGHRNIIQLLIENKALLNIKDYYGKTALDYASNKEIRKLLIKYGAKSGNQIKK